MWVGYHATQGRDSRDKRDKGRGGILRRTGRKGEGIRGKGGKGGGVGSMQAGRGSGRYGGVCVGAGDAAQRQRGVYQREPGEGKEGM